MIAKKILVVSPHPDDDIICCTQLMKKERSNIIVIYVTGGSNGSLDPKMRGEKLSKLRKDEAVSALTYLGIDKEKAIFLKFEDGTVSASKKKVRDALFKVIDSYEISELFYTSPYDVHPDHAAIGNILRKSSLQNLKKYEYVVHVPKLIDKDIKNPKNLLKIIRYWFIYRIFYTKVEIPVKDQNSKLQALQFHRSQLAYMSESTLKIARAPYETFYTKRD